MFVSILIPQLPIQVERKRDPLVTSLLIADTSRGSVFAASEDVLDSGVEVGMSLYRARQRAPFAQVVETDEDAYHILHDATLAALGEFSDRIETVALGEFLLEWRANSDFAKSGYATQVEALSEAIRTVSGLEVQIGVAAHRFTAQQAARRITDDGICLIRSESDARFLAQLPVTILPNAPIDVTARLAVFDIHTLGQLAALPKAAFVRQFGSALGLLHDLARGRDPRPLIPDVPPLRFVRERQFEDAIERQSVLVRAARSLAKAMSNTLTEQGYQAEAIKLSMTFASGQKLESTHPLKPPTGDGGRLVWYVTQLVETLGLSEPVTGIALIGYPVRPLCEGIRQLSLFEADQEVKRHHLDDTLQRLKRRFGERCIRVASRVGPPTPIPVQVKTNSDSTPFAICVDNDVLFVAVIEEFWREESGWWDSPTRRDYYRVVVQDGSHRNLFYDSISGTWYVDRAWYVL